MRRLKDLCIDTISKITLELWKKGYTSVLHQRITDILKSNRYFKNVPQEYYLDLGSGNSTFSAKIVSLLNPLHLLTSDINYHTDFKNHIVSNFNNEFLPFKDNVFDLITCVNVIEHLFDTDIFF